MTEIPVCPNCGERHHRIEPCEKPEPPLCDTCGGVYGVASTHETWCSKYKRLPEEP